jgi:hypothetical protein
MVSYNNMAKQRYIKWKVLIMLVSFTASFTVFCHCEKASSCCEKKTSQKKDDHGCQGMQAVKLNLQEKQAVAAFHLEALPMVLVERGTGGQVLCARAESGFSVFWSYKHSPPDRLALYQCFLI